MFDEMKVCSTCGQEKPLTEFYKYDEMSDLHFSNCKVCFRAKRKTHATHLRREIAGRSGEAILIAQLKQLGIYATPGKCSEWRWVDVVAWGCVKIEVKSGKKRSGGEYAFTFSLKQQRSGVCADIIALICDFETEHPAYYLFPANHPVFYDANNCLKSGVAYIPVAKHRKLSRSTLNPSIMAAHKDNWQLIESVRCEIADNLKMEMVGNPAIP